ncbi:cysteine--tRNA ligase [Lactobacillaceae bacterium L1_55_11]|nr:cysteine--tRNA ligase [Lactobacillaceae bacterium L1_55_11]
MLQIYNTYTLDKEPFHPIEDGKVRMYVCGPTVYNYIHLGNARSAIAFDTLRRYLLYRGYQVDYVSNFTDLGDKVIAQGEKEGLSEGEVAHKYEQAFDEDAGALNIMPATVRSKATDVMPEIIQFVADLVADGMAYEVEGDVYFRARQFPDYGHLSHQNLDELEENAAGRLDDEEAKRKEDPIDFALWKGEHRPGVTAWDSPWGPGRPGWHIECSVMVQKYLAPTIDIHGGGVDLTFPHHTNELAQSESRNHEPFVHYWMHNGFVNVDDQKMSKSLGNFTTVHDFLADHDDPEVLRLLLSKTHYRRPIHYSAATLEQAQIELNRLRRTYQGLRSANHPSGPVDEKLNQANQDSRVAFEVAMDDDFNTENALTAIYELVGQANQALLNPKISQESLAATADLLAQLVGIIGIVDLDRKQELTAQQKHLLDQRAQARAVKDFAESDRLRDELKEQGILVRDTPQGQQW